MPQVSKLFRVLLSAFSKNLLVKSPGTIICRRLYGPEGFLQIIGLVLLSTTGLSLNMKKNSITFIDAFYN